MLLVQQMARTMVMALPVADLVCANGLSVKAQEGGSHLDWVSLVLSVRQRAGLLAMNSSSAAAATPAVVTAAPPVPPPSSLPEGATVVTAATLDRTGSYIAVTPAAGSAIQQHQGQPIAAVSAGLALQPLAAAGSGALPPLTILNLAGTAGRHIAPATSTVAASASSEAAAATAAAAKVAVVRAVTVVPHAAAAGTAAPIGPAVSSALATADITAYITTATTSSAMSPPSAT